MQQGLSDEGINLVHIRRLIVSGGVGVVKETGAGVPTLLSMRRISRESGFVERSSARGARANW
jgi:hypothetical protein